MAPKMAEGTDSKRIESVALYRPKLAAAASGGGSSNKKKKKKFQVRLHHILFLVAYIYQVGWVVSTIGRPYREFLEKADREGFKGKCSVSNRGRSRKRVVVVVHDALCCVVVCVAMPFIPEGSPLASFVN